MAKAASRRVFWVLGLVLLVGGVVGAGWLLNNHPSAGAQEGDHRPSPGAVDQNVPVGIIADGYVDVKDGVRRLFPLRAGRVVWVAPEDKVCDKDEVVLRLDDTQARLDIDRATASLTEARAKLAQAKKLPRVRELDIEAQQAAVTAAEEQLKLAEQNQKLREALRGSGITITKSEISAGQAMVSSAKARVAAEKTKLKKLQEIDTTPEDVTRAQADVDARQAELEKAEKAREQLYQVRAPARGRILRVQTAAGELTGPQSPLVPVEFCPEEERIVRTEVMQDWANKVKVGQECEIRDDGISGHRWKGKVTHVADWFTHKRSIIQEPFQLNDVRTLECRVSIEGGADRLRIGQRLRVTIKQGGP